MSTPVSISVEFIERHTHAGHFVVVRTLEGIELYRTAYQPTKDQARSLATTWLETYRQREYACGAVAL